ncbi:MAG: xanthine dehydrogenase family protein molybdopterin-binding subunit [Dehalococcoidia bacterium]
MGDEVGAVVAAKSERIGEEALRLIKVEWEVLPFVLDPIESMQPGAPVIHPELSQSNILPAEPIGGADVFVNIGDVERGFTEADINIEVKAIYHNATQCSLDNWCCLASWKDDQLTVWSNSYEADQTRMFLSEMLEIPQNKVRVISPFVGGQFGRGDTGEDPFFIYTALLAKRTGSPVKFKHTRRESFHNTRQPIIYTCKMGAGREGTISSSYFKSIGNAGAYADHTCFATKFVPQEIVEVSFAHIPNVKMESYAVYTNKIPGCMMRGVGNNQFNLIFGLAVDALAEKLGIDPIELALKNFGHKWEKLPDKSLEAVLHEGARRIGWDKRHKPGKGRTYDGSKKRGIGFSFHPGWHAAWQEQRRGTIQAGIKLNPDGTVVLLAPTVECGPGSIVIEDGLVCLKAQVKKSITVKRLLQKGDLVPIVAMASSRPHTRKTGVPYQATFAEVEVDTATGQTQVLRMIILNDCGTVMFASGAEAQQCGGQCMTVGESLLEEIVYDEKTGVPLNFNWVEYKIPTIADMPKVEPVLFEVWRGAGEYGACGIGEGVVTCGPRAIANAIYNAIGVRIDDIPITPDKILKALGRI